MTSKTFDREEKRNHLLETASQVFGQQGYTNTRVSDIAERAGVAKGTVYEYFSSKEDLFFDVFKWFNVGVRESVNQVIAEHTSPRDRLVAILRLSGEIIVDHRELFPMMNVDLWVILRSSEPGKRFAKEFGEQYHSYRVLVADIIRDGQRCGEFRTDADPDSIATLLISTFDGLGMQYWLDDSIDPIRSSERFVLALCRGLCQEEQ
jgi:AcrR family transcriptional regulator